MLTIIIDHKKLSLGLRYCLRDEGDIQPVECEEVVRKVRFYVHFTESSSFSKMVYIHVCWQSASRTTLETHVGTDFEISVFQKVNA